MTTRSGRGRWERVLAARRQARAAIGRNPNAGDLFSGPPKQKAAPLPTPEPRRLQSDPSTTEYVLTLGEAAARLKVSHAELHAMIDRGELETLPMGLTRAIRTREVERLLAC